MNKTILGHAVPAWIALVLLGAGGLRTAAEDAGIFADINTSLGDFTCQLDHVRAPKAVANFIGLASGSRPWLDEQTGWVRTNAFFAGLTFHRVIAGFMIQGGSPNGQGTDGPGYVFPDEFDAALRHDGPGVLSLANSGPNSNGSQFFITVASAPWLDDVHTIFGRVTSGQSVVDAISQVATDTNKKPLTNVVIQSVSIRRVGPEAQAFDIQAQNLPVVSQVPLDISGGAGIVTLSFSNRLYAAHHLVASTNLVSWTPTSLGIETAPPLPNSLELPIAAPARFYALTQVQYPSSTFAPLYLANRTLTLGFNGGLGTLTILFDGTGQGTYTLPPGSPGTVLSYTWNQEAYRGFLWPIEFSGLVPMALRLDFTGDTTGSFSGTAYTTNPISVAGTFTLSFP
jgi:peptidyl-prolyl cis-trans isomerase A (cyclophilin A)